MTQTESDILKDAKEAFERAQEAEHENREHAREDLRFARLGEQWPEKIRRQRLDDNRPILTINRMPAFIRQVTNDARQNQPAIKVRPVDDGGDRETARIINGLIRNIENTSRADVAYDTATDNAVSCGVGYLRIGIDYARDDTFDLDIRIERVRNPFSIYGDPYSTAADSGDWNSAFVLDHYSKDQFERLYKNADKVDWEGRGYTGLGAPWFAEDSVMVAEYWVRDEVDRTLLLIGDPNDPTQDMVLAADRLEKTPETQMLLELGELVVKRERQAKSHRVRQHIVTGAEVLESNDWPGRYIPIVPVYGEEVDVEGKRFLRSLIRDAKDSQRMFNYWRTTTTELVALAPKAPWIGPVGAFDTDARKWVTANTENHAFLEYDVVDGAGGVPPQRQPFAGAPAGALQEALNASDDMKAILGLYDASLGARSNETSGRAIKARQRQGDVSTFHFIDNLGRAIRHTGQILLDLIPHVYDTPRILRVIGEDGREESVPVNQPFTDRDEDGAEIERIHDLTAGKYDLTVEMGPSFSTRREEAASQMTDLIRSFPQAAPIIGGLLAKNFDWPGAEEVAERLEAISPLNKAKGIPPEVQKLITEGQTLIGKLKAENEGLKADRALEAEKLKIDAFEAETKRMKVEGELAERV